MSPSDGRDPSGRPGDLFTKGVCRGTDQGLPRPGVGTRTSGCLLSFCRDDKETLRFSLEELYSTKLKRQESKVSDTSGSHGLSPIVLVARESTPESEGLHRGAGGVSDRHTKLFCRLRHLSFPVPRTRARRKVVGRGPSRSRGPWKGSVDTFV